MNRITDLLDLEDTDIVISDIQIQGQTKTLTLVTPPHPRYCPACGQRMHSRGTKNRRINHPILQDNYELILILKQRRWRCTNPLCKFDESESFKFVDKQRRTTNATDILIVHAFRDIMESSASIGRKFNVSDTQARDTFDRYIKLDRLPLTDAISVDEVFLDMDSENKYAMVIQDFHTGDPIDLLRSRRSETTEPYFSAIPPEERNAVRYLISDMYNPYIAYVDKYFPNAISVVDSFHVTQWLVNKLDQYIRQLIKAYKQQDRDREEELSAERGRTVTLPVSDEVYLLQNYRWLVLRNQSNIKYHADTRMDRHFRRYLNTYDYEFMLFQVDYHLEVFRDLKEKYILFNARNGGNPQAARKELNDLIHEYRSSGYQIFIEFADLLERYSDQIINSFIMVQKVGNGRIYDSRLSNGPIESINRKVKDLKRLGRGFKNFEHFRNRFLYATRQTPILKDIPDSHEVLYYEDND